MEITPRTTYLFDGQEFTDLSHVKTHVENEIGKILDQTPLRMDPKQALAVFDAIVKNKARLVALLTATYEPDDDSPPKNILDF